MLNKIDVPAARELADLVKPDFEERGYQVFEISAASGEGLRQLGFAMAALVAADRAARPPEVPAERAGSGSPSRPPTSRASRWSGSAKAYDHRREAAALGAADRLQQRQAVGYLADRLARLGVEEALAKAGAEAGAEVLIGEPDNAVVFDWEPAASMAGGSNRRTPGPHHGPRGTDPRL